MQLRKSNRTHRGYRNNGVSQAVAKPSPTEPSSPKANETRSLVLAALGAAAFVAISACSIRDCDLLSGNGTVKLPLLDVEVPVVVFFFSAPLFLLCLFLYVHMDILRAVDSLTPPARLQTWPLSEFPPPKRGEGLTIALISLAVVWGAWPTVMFVLAWKVLPLGHRWLGPLAVTTTTLSLAITVANYSAVHVRGHVNSLSKAVVAALVIAVAGFTFTGSICSHRVHPRELPAHFSDFKGADIQGLDMSGRNLREANFTKASLPHANLWKADLTRAVFTSTDLDFANLSDATLSGALFRGSHARGVDFGAACINAVDFAFLDFSDADLRDAKFVATTARRFHGANLSGASFWMANIFRGDFAGADLTRSVFSLVKGQGARFDDVRGSRPLFFKADLQGAYFARAQLERPNFTGAVLEEVDFAEASIVGALLAGARLDKANLQGCNFSGADVVNTSFAGATYDKFTTAPPGFDFKAYGMLLMQ